MTGLGEAGVGGGVSPVGTDLTLLLLFLANPFILSSIHLTLIFLAYLEKGVVGGWSVRSAGPPPPPPR